MYFCCLKWFLMGFKKYQPSKEYQKEYYNKIKLSKINNIEAVLLVDNIEQ